MNAKSSSESVHHAESIGIIGAGSIGIGWAIVFASNGYKVRVFDTDPAQILRFLPQVSSRLKLLRGFGLINESVESVVSRILPSDSFDKTCKNVTFIQECGPENLEAKRTIFKRAEKISLENTIFASSSSALKPSEMAEGLMRPKQLLVVHPANPPYLLPIAEVVPGPDTCKNVISRTVSLLNDLKMFPIIIQGEPEGFVFNRLQGAVLREAYSLIRDGVISPRDLDVLMTHGLGRRWSVIGPFATSALNVRGGITAHAARMGASYLRMGQERGQNDPWDVDLIKKVATDIEKKFPNEDWESNNLSRDIALMKILRNLKEDPDLIL